MNWELRFPIQDRSDLLATELRGVLSRAVEGGQLNESESPIVRHVAMRLLDEGGAEMTFGDAHDRLEAMSLPERQRLFDDARVANGMETIAQAEQQREDARFDRELERVTPPPPPPWSE